MYLKKILRELILLVLVIVTVACSSNKSLKKKELDKNTSVGIVNMNDDISPGRKMHFQIQDFQRNNVVYFDLDKYDIHSRFSQVLDAYACFLNRNPSYKVIVEGHADERGTPEYNIALGERRANAVKMYLQSQGASADQISIVSYGKEKPAILGHNEAAYAKNRRSILLIMY